MRRRNVRRRLNEMSIDKLVKKAIKSTDYPKVAELIVDVFDPSDFLTMDYFESEEVIISNYREAIDFMEDFDYEAIQIASDMGFDISNYNSIASIQMALAQILVSHVGTQLVDYIFGYRGVVIADGQDNRR